MARAIYHFDRTLLASCATSRAHYPEGMIVMGYEVPLEGIFISRRRAVGSTRFLATIVHDDSSDASENPKASKGRMPFDHASLWITRKVLRNLRKARGPSAVRIELGEESADWFFGDKKITVTRVLKYEPSYPDYRSLVGRVVEAHGEEATPVATIASDVLKIALNVADITDPVSEGKKASLRICRSSMDCHVIRYCSADGCAKNNIFSIVGALPGKAEQMSSEDIFPDFALMEHAGAPQPIWCSEDVDYIDDEVGTDDVMEEYSNDDESEYDPDEDDEIIDPDDLDIE